MEIFFCARGRRRRETRFVQQFLYSILLGGCLVRGVGGLTFQTRDLHLPNHDLLCRFLNNAFEAFLLFMRECDIVGSEFRTLTCWLIGTGGVDVEGELTVLRSFRSASTFFLCSSPTTLHVLGHTPEASSEPSQHSGSVHNDQINCYLNLMVSIPQSPSLTLELGIVEPICPSFRQ